MKCPKCGNNAQDDAIFCDQCGTRLAEKAPVAPEVTAAPAVEQPAPEAAPAPVAAPAASQGAVCPACGASNTPGEMFCADCGARLEAPQPEAAAVAATPAPAALASSDAPVCAACGASISPDDEFCQACGAVLKAQAAQPVAAAPALATPVPAVPTTAAGECPACGAATKAGDTFCEYCGAALVTAEGTAVSTAAAAAVQQAVVPPAAQPTQAGVGPFLVVVGSGVEIPLPTDRDVIVGREDPYSGVFPDVDLTPHGGVEGGVSWRHLRIRFAGSSYTLEDLNSTNYTLLNRQRVQPGVPAPLANGDEIAAGRVKLIFKVR